MTTRRTTAKRLVPGLLLMAAAIGGHPRTAAPADPRGMRRDRAATPRSLRDRIGAAHVAGRYNFTTKDFLNEGADVLLDSGMRVIKVYLHDPAGSYRFNSVWPRFGSLTEMARHAYYRTLFRKPFTTYFLTAYALRNRDGAYWRKGVSDEQYARERDEFRELATLLLTEYRGTGKTFVLQNWEGDWAIRGSMSTEPRHDPPTTAIDGMVRWQNARQEGVELARRAVGRTDVRVYHACEVNLVALAMEGRTTVTNNVLPRTRCDLYSYSAYDTIGAAADDPDKGRALFRRALDYLASKAPDSPAFGAKNVFIGEFGWPEVRSEQDPNADAEKCLRVLRMTVEEALDWGCPYLVYWQVYDNESRAGRDRPTNEQVRGFYLIRPDGSASPALECFRSLLR